MPADCKICICVYFLYRPVCIVHCRVKNLSYSFLATYSQNHSCNIFGLFFFSLNVYLTTSSDGMLCQCASSFCALGNEYLHTFHVGVTLHYSNFELKWLHVNWKLRRERLCSLFLNALTRLCMDRLPLSLTETDSNYIEKQEDWHKSSEESYWKVNGTYMSTYIMNIQ